MKYYTVKDAYRQSRSTTTQRTKYSIGNPNRTDTKHISSRIQRKDSTSKTKELSANISMIHTKAGTSDPITMGSSIIMGVRLVPSTSSVTGLYRPTRITFRLLWGRLVKI